MLFIYECFPDVYLKMTIERNLLTGGTLLQKCCLYNAGAIAALGLVLKECRGAKRLKGSSFRKYWLGLR